MSRRSSRSYDWGFPRWRSYGSAREPARVRTCDHQGCGDRGEYPAPKAPHSDEKWWFCAAHVADYNKNWNYFTGLSEEEVKERTRADPGYRQSQHWSWADHAPSPLERSALRVLDLEPDATHEDIKLRYRLLAKQFHPDHNPGNAEAAAKFHAVQMAYDTLKTRS